MRGGVSHRDERVSVAFEWRSRSRDAVLRSVPLLRRVLQRWRVVPITSTSTIHTTAHSGPPRASAITAPVPPTTPAALYAPMRGSLRLTRVSLASRGRGPERLGGSNPGIKPTPSERAHRYPNCMPLPGLRLPNSRSPCAGRGAVCWRQAVLPHSRERNVRSWGHCCSRACSSTWVVSSTVGS
jgi:hypothetical protein